MTPTDVTGEKGGLASDGCGRRWGGGGGDGSVSVVKPRNVRKGMSHAPH